MPQSISSRIITLPGFMSNIFSIKCSATWNKTANNEELCILPSHVECNFIAVYPYRVTASERVKHA